MIMQLLKEVYRRSLAPVAIVISALSAASAAFLLLVMPPRITRIDPAAVTVALVTTIVMFGFVVPVLTVLIGRRRRPSFPLAVAFLLVMFAHAVSLGEPVAVPGQSLTSVLALALGAAMAITVLVLAIEDQRSKKLLSAFRP